MQVLEPEEAALGTTHRMKQPHEKLAFNGKHASAGVPDAATSVHVRAGHDFSPVPQEMAPAHRNPNQKHDAYYYQRLPRHIEAQQRTRVVNGKDGAKVGCGLCCAGSCATLSDGAPCCCGGVLFHCMKELADLGELCCACIQCCACCCACGEVATVPT